MRFWGLAGVLFGTVLSTVGMHLWGIPLPSLVFSGTCTLLLGALAVALVEGQ